MEFYHNIVDDLTFQKLKESNYYRPEITEVMFDHNMMLEMAVHSMSIVEKGYDSVWDANMINFISKYFTNGIAHMEGLVREKGIKLRLLVEVTKENMGFINSIRSHEIRYLSEINGNFGIFDNRAYMVFIFNTKSDRLDQTLWSNSKALVDKQQSIFNKLWETSMPLSKRTKELGNEILPAYNKTIFSLEETRREISSLIESSRKELLVFVSTKVLNEIMTNNIFWNYFLPLEKRGVLVKVLIDSIDRHLLNRIRSINDRKNYYPVEVGYTNQLGDFNMIAIVSDSKYVLQIKYDKNNKLITSSSNEKHSVWVQEILFEKYWNEIKSLEVMNSN